MAEKSLQDAKKKTLIKAQQGELDGVETYLMLADAASNNVYCNGMDDFIYRDFRIK